MGSVDKRKGSTNCWKLTKELSLCCPLVCLPPLCGVAAKWLQEPCALQHIVAEPEGLGQRFLALPSHSLNETERRLLDEDGVLVIPGLLDNANIRELMIEALWQGGIPPHNVSLPNQWVSNGAIRALVRDGPFGQLAASALSVPSVRLTNSAAWFKKRAETPGPSQRWHVDDHLTDCPTCQSIGVWIALTDAPQALEFVLGSHQAEHDCKHYASAHDNVDQHCIEDRFARRLREARGREALKTLSFRAGDVALIAGKLWHRGRSHRQRRHSISLRFSPSGTRFERELTTDMGRSYYYRFLPEACAGLEGPLFPVVHPRDLDSFSSLQWPLVVTWRDFFLARFWRLVYEFRVFAGMLLFTDCSHVSK
eukprot:TRINITY_DN44871_c0_g1_i1.p1 TRINITY_DN44871_c0_g1~~TRINITY_DN44871_c0_g1_i1.p1  ORF type:complete len:385 (+),score=32.64 TRINITY_DN44871_c0_g1_i1:60-1157(+)